jgi:hypothetical protein
MLAAGERSVPPFHPLPRALRLVSRGRLDAFPVATRPDTRLPKLRSWSRNGLRRDHLTDASQTDRLEIFWAQRGLVSTGNSAASTARKSGSRDGPALTGANRDDSCRGFCPRPIEMEPIGAAPGYVLNSAVDGAEALVGVRLPIDGVHRSCIAGRAQGGHPRDPSPRDRRLAVPTPAA